MKKTLLPILMAITWSTTGYTFFCAGAKNLSVSQKSGTIKLLSPNLKSKKIEITTLTRKSYSFLGENHSRCMTKTSTIVNENGNFKFSKIKVFRGEYFQSNIYINDMWVIDEFSGTSHDDEKILISLTDPKKKFTLVEADISKLLEKYSPSEFHSSISEQLRGHREEIDSHIIEYLFDKDINEGDSIYLRVLDKCAAWGDESPGFHKDCDFVVRDGVLVPKYKI